jgi:hypothetical protein
MEPDDIRDEIDKTAERIGDELQLLTARARDATRTAFAWTILAVTTAGLVSVAFYLRRRRRGSQSFVRRQRGASPRPSGPQPVRSPQQREQHRRHDRHLI